MVLCVDYYVQMQCQIEPRAGLSKLPPVTDEETVTQAGGATCQGVTSGSGYAGSWPTALDIHSQSLRVDTFCFLGRPFATPRTSQFSVIRCENFIGSYHSTLPSLPLDVHLGALSEALAILVDLTQFSPTVI